MTPEQVKALTDEELRIRAAECLGARWYRSVFGSVVGRYLYIVPESHPGVEIVSIPADGTEPLCEGALIYIPDYPHDIAAAWELMGPIIAAGFAIEVIPGVMVRLLFRSEAKFVDNCLVGVFDEIARFIGLGRGPGEEDARNITRAFILAMSGGADAPK